MTIDRYRDEAGRLWVVVCAEHKREAVANMNLLEAGIQTFWVHFAHTARHGHRTWPTLRSYYPGYLFAAVDDPIQIGPIGHTRAVDSVLWSPDDQHYIPPAWLSAMRAECLTGDGLHEPPSSPVVGRTRYAPGTAVRTTGAWDQFVSTVLIDRGTSIEVEHGQIFGKRLMARYTPEQVEVA